MVAGLLIAPLMVIVLFSRKSSLLKTRISSLGFNSIEVVPFKISVIEKGMFSLLESSKPLINKPLDMKASGVTPSAFSNKSLRVIFSNNS